MGTGETGMAGIMKGRGGGYAIVVGLALWLWPAAARADMVRFLLERADRKTTTVALVRQALDLTRGFDHYFLELFAAPANKRKSGRELGASGRSLAVRSGQFELHMAEVRKEREKQLERLARKGYRPVCVLFQSDTPDQSRTTFDSFGTALTLFLESGKRDTVRLGTEGGKSYRLMTLGPASGRAGSAGQVVRRALSQVVLLNGGRMLAVVIRSYGLPSPPHLPEEQFYFYPLRRATRRLGVKYPLDKALCSAVSPGPP